MMSDRQYELAVKNILGPSSTSGGSSTPDDPNDLSTFSPHELKKECEHLRRRVEMLSKGNEILRATNEMMSKELADLRKGNAESV